MPQRPFAGIRVRCSGQMGHYHRNPPPFLIRASLILFRSPDFHAPLLTSLDKLIRWMKPVCRAVEHVEDGVVTKRRSVRKNMKRMQILGKRRRKKKTLACHVLVGIFLHLVSYACFLPFPFIKPFIVVSPVPLHLWFNIFSDYLDKKSHFVPVRISLRRSSSGPRRQSS